MPWSKVDKSKPMRLEIVTPGSKGRKALFVEFVQPSSNPDLVDEESGDAYETYAGAGEANESGESGDSSGDSDYQA